MNISVLQPKLSVGKRANNLSDLKHMIRSEARRIPAPDLIVLPDCCVGTQEVAEDFAVSEAMCQGFAEAFSFWAREWGIWIAVGHSELVDSQMREVATLFDPDGDPFIRATETDSGPGERGPCEWVSRVTPIGCIALRVAEPIGTIIPPPSPANQPLDLIIFPTPKPNITSAASFARSCSSFVVAIGCALDEGEADVQSIVLDREGTLLAEAIPGKSCTLRASISTHPPAPKCADEWEDVNHIE
ncbi:MAG: carbon-nitrogen hydrolase family protein [Planctomycetes bacterium]|nr:carbon-nitrogen hydrolase family protein [Planctomycetota bacterium]